MQKKYLLGVILIGMIAFTMVMGCTSIPFFCEEQSRQELEKCNIDCGEGIFSSVCKTNCTIEHNNRMDECVGK